MHHQVLCITHLPQVAAPGTSHLRVLKRIESGRTRADVEPLAGHERVEELLVRAQRVAASAQ